MAGKGKRKHATYAKDEDVSSAEKRRDQQLKQRESEDLAPSLETPKAKPRKGLLYQISTPSIEEDDEEITSCNSEEEEEETEDEERGFTKKQLTQMHKMMASLLSSHIGDALQHLTMRMSKLEKAQEKIESRMQKPRTTWTR